MLRAKRLDRRGSRAAPSSPSWPLCASSIDSALARATISGGDGFLGRRQQAEAAQRDADPQLPARPGQSGSPGSGRRSSATSRRRARAKSDTPANSVSTPSAICARWRRTMLPKGIEPSSRRCGFQPVSRPDRIWTTEPDWISIMIGASSADMRVSSSAERTSRIAPPHATRVGAVDQRGDQAEEFGREQHAHRQFEQLAARVRRRSAARRETAKSRR